MGDLTFSKASDEKVVTFKRVGTEAALRRELREHPPDLILSDYDLPGLDGISALRIARKLVPWPNLEMLSSFCRSAVVQA